MEAESHKCYFNVFPPSTKVYESRYIAYLATSGCKREATINEHVHYVYRQIK